MSTIRDEVDESGLECVDVETLEKVREFVFNTQFSYVKCTSVPIDESNTEIGLALALLERHGHLEKWGGAPITYRVVDEPPQDR